MRDKFVMVYFTFLNLTNIMQLSRCEKVDQSEINSANLASSRRSLDRFHTHQTQITSPSETTLEIIP